MECVKSMEKDGKKFARRYEQHTQNIQRPQECDAENRMPVVNGGNLRAGGSLSLGANPKCTNEQVAT